MTVDLLKLRVEGIHTASTRARVAFFVCTIVATAILTALWNEYLAWDLIVFDEQATQKPQGKPPQAKAEGSDSEPWAITLKREANKHTVKAIIENQQVGVSLLGLRISGSDLAVIGSFAVFVVTMYYCMCARRANHEIGTLLRELKNAAPDCRRFAYFGIRSDLVLISSTDDDEAYRDLASPHVDRPKRVLRHAVPVLNYLGVTAIFAILPSDVYYALKYALHSGSAAEPRWESLPLSYKWQLGWMDGFAIVTAVVVFFLTKYVGEYNRGTSRMLADFCHKYRLDTGRRITDPCSERELALRGFPEYPAV